MIVRGIVASGPSDPLTIMKGRARRGSRRAHPYAGRRPVPPRGLEHSRDPHALGRRPARPAVRRRRRRRPGRLACWVRRCAQAGHRVVAVSAVSDASRRRVDALLPGVAGARRRRRSLRGRRPGAAHRPRRRAARAGRRARRRRRRPGRPAASCTPAGGTASAVLDAVDRARGAAARAAPGDDVHRPARGPGPARPAPASASPRPTPLRPIARGAGGGDGRGARSGSRRTRARSTTRRSRGGANHLATLVNESVDLLRRCGVEEPERLLAPLLGASLDNALRSGDAALTGPVARGDAGTVAAHVAVLRDGVAGHAPRPTSRWPG